MAHSQPITRSKCAASLRCSGKAVRTHHLNQRLALASLKADVTRGKRSNIDIGAPYRCAVRHAHVVNGDSHHNCDARVSETLRTQQAIKCSSAENLYARPTPVFSNDPQEHAHRSVIRANRQSRPAECLVTLYSGGRFA